MDTPTNPETPSAWIGTARRELLGLRAATTGWGYRKGSRPSVEPTALAGLGLVASADASLTGAVDSLVRPAADWLASVQNQDGSLGLSAGQPSPCWTTPYALLLWSALPGFEKPARSAAAWLLQQQGRTSPADTDPGHVVGHDPTLVGWPWVADTHSWLEPTAIAVLALCGQGYGDHPRVRQGVRLINDRALPDGGWNYGNKSAFGNDLRAQPGPTGLALLALARAVDSSNVVTNAIQYLLKILPTTRAPASLGWGVLGLRAWNRDPAESSVWLAESYRQTTGRPDVATRLALLLLAAGDASGPLFKDKRTGGRRG